ncbi:unnamed protein product [Macrosiphum euphorbiae]|uniref:Uncharacterized protein n=1 Tax=Macrosiphum euphorbiae TaxID=13131 RepID=A0AAV0VMA6_9HEMI|nr:unnamed protein product [Macrosiphum euphorbiae]
MAEDILSLKEIEEKAKQVTGSLYPDNRPSVRQTASRLTEVEGCTPGRREASIVEDSTRTQDWRASQPGREVQTNNTLNCFLFFHFDCTPPGPAAWQMYIVCQVEGA